MLAPSLHIILLVHEETWIFFKKRDEDDGREAEDDSWHEFVEEDVVEIFFEVLENRSYNSTRVPYEPER